MIPHNKSGVCMTNKAKKGAVDTATYDFSSLFRTAKNDLKATLETQRTIGILVIVDMGTLVSHNGINPTTLSRLIKLQSDADKAGIASRHFSFIFLQRECEGRILGGRPITASRFDSWLKPLSKKYPEAFNETTIRRVTLKKGQVVPDDFFLYKTFTQCFHQNGTPYARGNILLFSADNALLHAFEKNRMLTMRAAPPQWRCPINFEHYKHVMQKASDLKKARGLDFSKIIVHVDIDDSLLHYHATMAIWKTVLNQSVVDLLLYLQEYFRGKIEFRVSTARAPWDPRYLNDPAHVERVVDAFHKAVEHRVTLHIDAQSQRSSAGTDKKSLRFNWKHYAFSKEPGVLNILVDDNCDELMQALGSRDEADPDALPTVTVLPVGVKDKGQLRFRLDAQSRKHFSQLLDRAPKRDAPTTERAPSCAPM